MPVQHLKDLWKGLEHSPVIGSLVANAHLDEYVESASRVAIVANVAIRDLPDVIETLSANGKFVLVNIDSCPGLGQDKGGLDYVQALGTPGIISTRVSLVQRANALGMVTIQKVFITDRSNLPRSMKSVELSKPTLVELMPWPVIPFIERTELNSLKPFVAAGFVKRPEDVIRALAMGASAVATSDPKLWAMTYTDFKTRADELRAARGPN